MDKSESIKEICTALNKFQQEVKNPKNSETNNFFKSKYAPLDAVINAIKPALTKNGLAIFQNVSGNSECITVTTMLTHISGEWLESSPLMLNISENKGVSPAQAAGISITYARRYQLSAMLGISSEDDTDGNASKAAPEEPKPKPEAKEPTPEEIARSAEINRMVGALNTTERKEAGKKILAEWGLTSLKEINGKKVDEFIKKLEGT